MCADPHCPWGIGKHPATLADARDELMVIRALQYVRATGEISPEEAERRYRLWRESWMTK